MNYQQAADLLADVDCIATAEPFTRIRRESPKCIALYYQGRPILKWLDNGEVIIHNRGMDISDAPQSRIRQYCPIHIDVWGYSGSIFTIALPPTISGGGHIRVRHGVRLNPNAGNYKTIN